MSVMRKNYHFFTVRCIEKEGHKAKEILYKRISKSKENEEKIGRKVHVLVGSKRESIEVSSMQHAYIHLLLLSFLVSFSLLFSYISLSFLLFLKNRTPFLSTNLSLMYIFLRKFFYLLNNLEKIYLILELFEKT